MAYKKIRFLSLVFVLTASLALSACSSSREMNNDVSSYNPDGTYDPIEPINRAVFTVNGVIDKVVFRPVTEVYRTILPEVVRDSVRSFLRNLRSPVDLANQVLQGDVDGAGHVLARFMMNTTLGVGGLFDVAEEKGFEYEREDFGQTLAIWGVGEGPYVVLPIIGPSNARDALGSGVDLVSDPVTINNTNTHREWAQYGRAGLTIVDAKARLIDPLAELEKNSLDYYAAIRSVYKQFRDAEIADRKTGEFGVGVTTANSGANEDVYDAYEELEGR